MRILRKNTSKWYVEVFEYLCKLKLGMHSPENPYNLNFTPRRLIKKIIKLGVFKAPHPFTWMNVKVMYKPRLSIYHPSRMYIKLILHGTNIKYDHVGNVAFWHTIIAFRVLYKLAKMIMENKRTINVPDIVGYCNRLRNDENLLNNFETYVFCHYGSGVYHVARSHYNQHRIILSLAYSVIYLAYDEKTYKYTIRDYGVVTSDNNIIAVADAHWCTHNTRL